MNLLPATIVSVEEADANGSATARFAVLGETISAAVDRGRRDTCARKQSDVWASVRAASNSSIPARRTRLHASVDITEPMGAETLAHLVEQGADLRCVVPSNVHTRRWRDGSPCDARSVSFMCSTTPANIVG